MTDGCVIFYIDHIQCKFKGGTRYGTNCKREDQDFVIVMTNFYRV